MGSRLFALHSRGVLLGRAVGRRDGSTSSLRESRSQHRASAAAPALSSGSVSAPTPVLRPLADYPALAVSAGGGHRPGKHPPSDAEEPTVSSRAKVCTL